VADGGQTWAAVSRATIRRLRGMRDPVKRAQAVAAELDKLNALVSEVSRVRLEAVAELRAGSYSYGKIADALDLTKGRVAQLSREAVALVETGRRRVPKASQPERTRSRRPRS